MKMLQRSVAALFVLLATSASAAVENGKPAPDFTLNDLQGKPVKLSSFKGKKVVLEWFNPECPFVVYAHTKGPLKDMAERYAKQGVVWLAINSNAPGKQGSGLEKNRQKSKEYGMTHPVLLDEKGAVGKLYGATSTPHMFVIDEKGVLIYQGAIDNAPLGEPEGKAVTNHVDRALEELSGGKAISTPRTKAYGCSVKYAG